MPSDRTKRLAQLDRDHVWHPFTPMRQWRDVQPLIIDHAQGVYLYDTEGRRYIDGVSSLWCNVHGHRVPAIDAAIRDQLDQVAHTTLLGLASPPSIELAAQLVERVNSPDDPRHVPHATHHAPPSPDRSRLTTRRARLNKVFFSDSGATALEVAFKMAVGYWHHTGRPDKSRFIGIRGAYHGDTTGAMSIGFSDLFHQPFRSMVFDVRWAPAPDAARVVSARPPSPGPHVFPSEDVALCDALRDRCLAELAALLDQHAHETAAIVIEPIMQGAAGMICQPPGYLRGVAELARRHNVLLIADEVATGFGRTGKMFACEHEHVAPDILCLAKGITGGYLPLAATLATDEIEEAFCSPKEDPNFRGRTLFHGHTYTGNPLACAAALASLKLFDETNLLDHINASSALIADRLSALRDCPHVADIRQRGLMVGIELCHDRNTREPFDFTRPAAATLCAAMRSKGLILRPLGDVLVLMPIPATPHEVLHEMLDIVVDAVETLSASCPR